MSPVDRQPAAGEDTLAQILEGGRASLGDLTGTTLGDFQVERLLGRGGMGEVYLATQLSLNRPVALKVLRPDVMVKPGYRERFESEAIAVAKLNHPNIVHVYAMAKIDQVHFIAMEYVEGTNLREYVVKRGALDLPQVALDHEADGAGDRGGRRGRADPPRRQAREHPDHPAGPGEGRRFRPVPPHGRGRCAPDPGRGSRWGPRPT